MVRHGALTPGTRIADLQEEHCAAASPLGFEHLVRSTGQGEPCRLLEYMPVDSPSGAALQVAAQGAARLFDPGGAPSRSTPDRFRCQRRGVSGRAAPVRRARHGPPAAWRGIEQRVGAEYWCRHAVDLPTCGAGFRRQPRAGPAAPRRRWLARCRLSARAPPRRRPRCCWPAELARWALAASLPGLIDADDPTLAPEQLLDPDPRARAPSVCGPMFTRPGGGRPLAIAGWLPPPAHDGRPVARPLAQYAGGLEPGDAGGHRPRPSPDPTVSALEHGRLPRGYGAGGVSPAHMAVPADAPSPQAAAGAAVDLPPPLPAPSLWHQPRRHPSRGVRQRRLALAVALVRLFAALAIWSALHLGLHASRAPSFSGRNEMPVSEVRSSK